MPRYALSNLTLSALRKEIERRTAKLDALKARRGALDRQIAELEGIAGHAPKADRKRGPEPKAWRAKGRPLAEYVREVLAAAEKGLSLKEIEAKVLAAGYPTTAASIYKPIMAVLGKGFRRVERGVYAVKAAMKAARKAGKAAVAPVAKAGREAKAPVARKPAKRGVFPETAEQFILGLVKGEGATTAQINQRWSASGRPGSASPNLSVLFKARKLKREPLKGERGFLYTVAARRGRPGIE